MEKVNKIMTALGNKPLVCMSRESENEFKFTFVGGLFKALDRLVYIESMIDKYLGNEYNIQTIYGEGLDVTFKITEK